MKIGLLDSGLGGVSVLKDFLKNVSHIKFIYYADLKYAPYGEKNKSYIKDRVISVIEKQFQNRVDALLIACNTATWVCISYLRKRYNFPIFGMQPALKPACTENPNQPIGVLATPIMIEKGINELEKFLNIQQSIYYFPCKGLSNLIDNFQFKEVLFYIEDMITDIKKKQIGVIVLGCTHYVFLKSIFLSFLSSLKIYDGNIGTISHIKEQLQLKSYKANKNQYEIYSSLDNMTVNKEKIEYLLNFHFGEKAAKSNVQSFKR